MPIYNPFRTTSYMQFFKEKPGHEEMKPFTCRVPVSPESQLQSNLDGDWAKIMLTDV